MLKTPNLRYHVSIRSSTVIEILDFRTKEQARERMRVREKGSKNPAPQDRKREHCLLLTDRRLLEDGFPEDQPGDQRLLSVMNVYESSKQRVIYVTVPRHVRQCCV